MPGCFFLNFSLADLEEYVHCRTMKKKAESSDEKLETNAKKNNETICMKNGDSSALSCVHMSEKNGGDDDAQSDDSTLFETKNNSADELLEEGKRLFREKDVNLAVEFFSRAVERKHAELQKINDFHPSLAAFYLWFGDALLTKEELNDEIFHFKAGDKADVKNTAVSSSVSQASTKVQESSAEGKDFKKEEAATCQKEDNVPEDEELAFEMLEMAKKCLRVKLDGKQKTEIDVKDVIDLSFAHIRLADIQLMNNNFEGALLDYREAVDIRESYKLPKQTLLAPLLSLSQAALFNGQKKEALDFFLKTLNIGKNILNCDLPLPDGIKREVVSDTVEDLQIQVDDLTRQIRELEQNKGISQVAELTTKGSQTGVENLVTKTTSSFDAPQLVATIPEKRIAVRPTEVVCTSGLKVEHVDGSSDCTISNKSSCHENSQKKRRINLKPI